MVDKHNFHIILNDESERNVKGDEFKLDQNNNLVVVNQAQKPVVVYNANHWRMIETEARDDRGYPSDADATRQA